MHTVYVPGGGKCPSQPGNFDPHTIVLICYQYHGRKMEEQKKELIRKERYE